MNKQILLAVTIGLAVLANTARAAEGGSTHYIPGQTTDFSGMAPTQPGWIFANYVMNYNDANYGNELQYGPHVLALGVTANATAEVPTLIYAYPFDFLGGTLSSGVSVPIQWITIKAKATLSTPTQQITGSQEQSVSGLGDIEFMPLMAAWTNGDFSINGMFNVWAPTGSYDQNNLANLGLGYWTFEPMVAASWISSKLGTEVTVFTALDFNTENTEANYQSGDIFHVDATVAQHLPLAGGLAGVGASAFYLKQITGDSGSGAQLGGFEMETYGVGPTISFLHPLGKTTMLASVSWLPMKHIINKTVHLLTASSVLASCLFAVALLAGCASTKVTDSQQFVQGMLPKPAVIWVYDFALIPADVPAESPLASPDVPAVTMTPEELDAGRQASALLSSNLVEDINAMGMTAQLADAATKPAVNDLVIRGYFLSVEAGSTAKRVALGFGAGGSSLEVAVEGYQQTTNGLRKLGQGNVDSGSAKGPGTAVGVAAFIATANPVGLIVNAGSKAYGEASGKSKLEGRARATAKEIADNIKPKFMAQGWID